MNVGLVYDLRSEYLAMGFSEEDVAEFDSEATILAIEEAIVACGNQCTRIGHGRELARRLVAGERWDMVFTVAEGLHGRSREAQVPCLLEMYGVPYTFSDPLVCAVTLDKAVTKRILLSAGIPTAPFAIVRTPADADKVHLRYPLFVKPVAEGTGKGIDSSSRIVSPDMLKASCVRLLDRFRQPVLVEEYLPGREFTTGILGTGEKARVLGTLEICVLEGAPAPDYSYAVKENCESWVAYRPVPPGKLRSAVEKTALDAYLLLECRDAARVDIRLDAEDRPAVMELNPLPGLHPTHSDLPMIATQEGMPYVELIRSILESAATRSV
ncbi:MAG: D-alanine--D-alanine ligase [Kiritimatiellae bacterium]|nr:D-alanine--D-alanine ligase [Kiritimatiellia bacterium]